MYARVATFESRPENVEDAIAMIRAQVESDETPLGPEGAKMLMLVNRETGERNNAIPPTSAALSTNYSSQSFSRQT